MAKSDMDISSYKTPCDGEPNLVSISVTLCKPYEAKAIMEFAKQLRTARGATQSFTIYSQVVPPGPPDNEWKPDRLEDVRREFRDFQRAPDGWQKEWSATNNRVEYRELVTGKRFFDNGQTMVEITRVPRCSNGHALDYGNQICNICGARMPLREGETGWKKAPDDDVFGDADLIKQREARQDEFDRQRKEQQRIRSVDPTGRFSGLELD